MARIALLGGSFNPPHIAHQMMALWALAARQADEVWLVPCFQHPFGKDLTPFDHRLRMCELAAAALATERVQVSRVEEELGGESRTLRTVEHVRARWPEHELVLLIGSDILGERRSWHRFEEIERLASIVVVGRSGHAAPTDAPLLPPISSREIRRRLVAGEDVSELVPATVLEYIRGHRLYAGPAT